MHFYFNDKMQHKLQNFKKEGEGGNVSPPSSLSGYNPDRFLNNDNQN